MKYIILTLLLLGCGGNIDTVHDTLDCVIMGQDCPGDRIDQLGSELISQDAQIKELLLLLDKDSIDVTEIVNLCGNNAEVLVRFDNLLVAFFKKGSRQYLDVLEPGRYVSTDGFGCKFEVKADYTVEYL